MPIILRGITTLGEALEYGAIDILRRAYEQGLSGARALGVLMSRFPDLNSRAATGIVNRVLELRAASRALQADIARGRGVLPGLPSNPSIATPYRYGVEVEYIDDLTGESRSMFVRVNSQRQLTGHEIADLAESEAKRFGRLRDSPGSEQRGGVGGIVKVTILAAERRT